MTKSDMYAGVDFHIYPLELFILIVGFVFGILIGSINNTRIKRKENLTESKSNHQHDESVIHQSSAHPQSPQNLILSYSLSTGQSFQINGTRHKLFKGHLYKFLPLQFHSDQQDPTNPFEIFQSTITKKQKQNQWIKLYNPLNKLPKEGKYYFNIFVVKNEYFVKRQASQKAISNIAVSRTDIIVGFILARSDASELKFVEQVDSICHQAQRDTNGIPGIVGYGFNGKIYSNGDLRIEEKIIKKNRTLSVMVNRDEGFLGFEVEGETVGFVVVPREKELVPFVEMFAVGSSVVLSG